MPQAHDFLDNDGHLFFAGIATSGLCVVACLSEKGGSVNELNGFNQSPKAGVGIKLVVRDHLGRVDAGEGAVECIFEQA